MMREILVPLDDTGARQMYPAGKSGDDWALSNGHRLRMLSVLRLPGSGD